MLAPALRRHRSHGALDELEQRLLDALAGNVARNGGVVRLARNLVDLVDVDDPGLGLLDIVVALLKQLLDDVLHVLAHVTGLGQRGGVGDGEGHIEDARERLGQQGLAAAGRSDQQDVALCDLHVGRVLFPAPRPHALEVVVDRHRQHLLGPVLADHVFVQELHDPRGQRQGHRLIFRAVLEFLADDVDAQLHALVADVHGRARYELAYLMLALAAERTVEEFPLASAATIIFAGHSSGAMQSRLWARWHCNR